MESPGFKDGRNDESSDFYPTAIHVAPTNSTQPNNTSGNNSNVPLQSNSSSNISQEISREEILRQIFGDVGELIHGKLASYDILIIYVYSLFCFPRIRLFMCC